MGFLKEIFPDLKITNWNKGGEKQGNPISEGESGNTKDNFWKRKQNYKK